MSNELIALVVSLATLVVGWLKRKEVKIERWESLLGMAETAWQAVEAWKAKERKVRGSIPPPMGGLPLPPLGARELIPGEVKPTETEDVFVGKMKAVTKLDKGEEKKLREWVRMRSLAGKHKNGLTLNYPGE